MFQALRDLLAAKLYRDGFADGFGLALGLLAVAFFAIWVFRKL
jgi:hypothetical protein